MSGRELVLSPNTAGFKLRLLGEGLAFFLLSLMTVGKWTLVHTLVEAPRNHMINERTSAFVLMMCGVESRRCTTEGGSKINDGGHERQAL